METTPLCKLALEYGTDKTFVHSYTPVYHSLFADKRHKVKRVLEIGIGTESTMNHVANYKAGASLRMWKNYFPFAHIVGIDIDAETKKVEEERIEVIISDQGNFYNLCQIAKNYGPFDLVVDDGSHNPILQIITARAFAPAVIHGGIYSVEDTTDSIPLELKYTFLQNDMIGRQISGNGINDDGLFLAWRPIL